LPKKAKTDSDRGEKKGKICLNPKRRKQLGGGGKKGIIKGGS